MIVIGPQRKERGENTIGQDLEKIGEMGEGRVRERLEKGEGLVRGRAKTGEGLVKGREGKGEGLARERRGGVDTTDLGRGKEEIDPDREGEGPESVLVREETDEIGVERKASLTRRTRIRARRRRRPRWQSLARRTRIC